MTKAQNTLYWREWNAARKAADLEEPDRHQLHVEALGEDKSSKDFTNEDLDRVLATFLALSRPTSIRAQTRQQEQPNTRKLHKIAVLLKCLGLFVAEPVQYMGTLLRDRFHVELLEDLARVDLNHHLISDRADIQEATNLDHLIWTLTRALSAKRRKGDLVSGGQAVGLTEHDMCRLAGVECFRPKCARCWKEALHRAPATEVAMSIDGMELPAAALAAIPKSSNPF